MMEGIFVCAAPHCLKSFLKKVDFEAHVHAVHADLINSTPQKDGNESEAVSARKPTTSDSTVQAPTPRPVQDGEERTPRSQPPPLRPLVQPKLNPPQTDNRPHGFDGSMAGDQQQGIIPQASYAQYPLNALQPPNFVVPVNPNVMGPTSFGQPPYVGGQAPETGVEQGALLGYPQPWNVGPNGAPFDPSMIMNQGGFFQGAPPPNIAQGGNANDLRDGRGNLLPPPPTLAPQFTQMPGNFYGGDSNNHGQGYGWQQDKRDSFGNGQD
ncbi:E3 ubiquitin protein ligase HAKAI [Tanacetum coccineum]